MEVEFAERERANPGHEFTLVLGRDRFSPVAKATRQYGACVEETELGMLHAALRAEFAPTTPGRVRFGAFLA